MKLVFQVPCLNEAPHIAAVIASLPRTLDGVDAVEVLVIDDGSTDGTAEAARAAGAEHLIRFPHNRGLAVAFQTGLREALRAGADIIVNTDADGQYDSSSVPALIAPILGGQADIVVGDRSPHTNPEFSWAKRRLQRIGSRTVAFASRSEATDVTSGFRAYTREAALDLIVANRFTYTVESTIQAGLSPFRMVWVPVRTNPSARPSRLARTTFGHVRRNAPTVVRALATYRPLPFFGLLSFGFAIGALVALLPSLSAWGAQGDRNGDLPSIVLGSLLAMSALLMFAVAVLGDMIGFAREVSHRTLVEVRGLTSVPEASTGTPGDGTSRLDR